MRQAASSGISPEKSAWQTSASAPPVGETGLPCRSVNTAPKALSIPSPPSFVALPPMPISSDFAPHRMACAISSPVPKLVVFRGSRCAAGTYGKPLACAISSTAVCPSPSKPHCASTGMSSGPVTRVVIRFPPIAQSSASTVPSPPSAMGSDTVSASGKMSAAASCSKSQISTAVSDPLNESDAKSIFISGFSFLSSGSSYHKRQAGAIFPACRE